MNNRTMKSLTCDQCDTSLRVCAKGIICKKNHLIEKNTEQYLDIQAAITGISRPICIECELLISKCNCEISGGFMLKTRMM